jgi:hypothetical protein
MHLCGLHLSYPGEGMFITWIFILQLLIDELQLLWTQGVQVTNVSKPPTNQLLIVNAILLWTLHDYLGLGVMSSISSSCIV